MQRQVNRGVIAVRCVRMPMPTCPPSLVSVSSFGLHCGAKLFGKKSGFMAESIQFFKDWIAQEGPKRKSSLSVPKTTHNNRANQAKMKRALYMRP
jgi:hypothetical protein